jgi:hypothetical protein
MPKKNRNKKIFEDLEIASAEAHAGSTEPTGGDAEHSTLLLPGQGQENEEQAPAQVDASAGGEQSEHAAEEMSPDDILADVRHTLIEDETHEKEGQSQKWWRRIGRGSRKNAVESEPSKAPEEVELPASPSLSIDEQYKEAAGSLVEYQNELDELIDLLHTDDAVTEKPAPIVEDVPPEPENVIDFDELKKQAFQHRPSEADAESLSEVRAIALEDGEEVFIEVDSRPHDPFEERMKAVENAFKPYRRQINFAFAFLGLAMAVIAAGLLFNAYRGPAVEQDAAAIPNVPFPASVSLPGGWTFSLGRGTLDDGNWNPDGAEWLMGTEVCRWVALPWSRQLEAVVRTLNQDDQIQLGMSNSDKLIYKVYSIEQLSPQEMQKLDSNSPCLLIVLAEPGAEKRWVLTSLP